MTQPLSGAFEAIVEIPKGTRNKYEYDHDRQAIFLDRRLFSATYYPADYGFLAGTLAEDGDPLDVLVLLEEATFPGCHIMVKPIGVFWMTDEKGKDAKVLAVPAAQPPGANDEDNQRLDPHLCNEIAHFFEVYKDLEPAKHTHIGGFGDRAAAMDEIHASIGRYRQRHPPSG